MDPLEEIETEDAHYFPTVGLHSPQEKIRFRFSNFKFDVAQCAQEYYMEERNDILKEEMGNLSLFRVVRAYLINSGFHKTFK